MSTPPPPPPTTPLVPPGPAPSQPVAAPLQQPQRGGKRWLAFSIFLVFLVLAGIAGTIYWLHARQFEETDDAIVDGDIVPISAQIAGPIKKVEVQDNQDVAAGDLIAQIDPTDFNTRIDHAKAALSAAQARVAAAQATVDLTRVSSDAMIVQGKAGVAQAEAAVSAARSQVESAQADIAAAQSEADRRQADLKRYEALDPRAISQQVRDAARSAADSANAELSAAQKKALTAQAQVIEAQSRVLQAQGVLQTAQTAPQQIANAEAQVKTAQAMVAEAQAELSDAQQQLSYTTITARTGGRITRKAVEPGQYVEAGQTLCAIVKPEVWVTANFKETQLTHMHQGQLVDIWVDAYPGRSFRGRVASIQGGTGARFSLMPPENATGNFVKVVQRVPVKITFDEDPAARQLLGPGMSVTPRVHIAGDEGTPAPIARGAAPITQALNDEVTR